MQCVLQVTDHVSLISKIDDTSSKIIRLVLIKTNNQRNYVLYILTHGLYKDFERVYYFYLNINSFLWYMKS